VFSTYPIFAHPQPKSLIKLDARDAGITGIALGWIGSTTAFGDCRQEAIDEAESRGIGFELVPRLPLRCRKCVDQQLYFGPSFAPISGLDFRTNNTGGTK
jgi:hypothetical protein